MLKINPVTTMGYDVEFSSRNNDGGRFDYGQTDFNMKLPRPDFFGEVRSSNLNSSWDEGIEALFFMPEHLAHPK